MFCFSEIVENPEEYYDDTVASGTNIGYAMTDNSAYRVGTQSDAQTAQSAQTAHTEEKRSDTGGGDATLNFDMTSNTAYTSYK